MLNRKRQVSLFAAILVCSFVFFSTDVAWSAAPRDILGGRSTGAIYVLWDLENVGDVLRTIFSTTNVELIGTLLSQKDDSEKALLDTLAVLVQDIPAKRFAGISGVTVSGDTFTQVGVAFPAEYHAQVEAVTQGKADPVGITKLLLSDNGVALAPLLDVKRHQGIGEDSKKTYYSLLNEQLYLTASDGVLLLGSDVLSLGTGLQALRDPQKRLVFSPRFGESNYLFAHIDYHTMQEITQDRDLKSLADFFVAPLEMEFHLQHMEDRYRLSAYANTDESILPKYRIAGKPQERSGAFLVGEGVPVFVFSTVLMSINGMGEESLISHSLSQVFDYLKQMDVSKEEVLSLFSSSLSLASIANNAEISGTSSSIPSLYIAVTGKDGAAASLFKKIRENENFSGAIPTTLSKVGGWDAVATSEANLSPVPLVFGVKGETFFAGIQKLDSLTKTPDIPNWANKAFAGESYSSCAIDLREIKQFAHWLINDSQTPLKAFLGGQLDIIKQQTAPIWNAELAIPYICSWSPSETIGFADFYWNDVPEGKGLLENVLRILQKQ